MVISDILSAPSPPVNSGGNFTSFGVTDANRRLAMIFQVPKTGTLNYVIIKAGTTNSDGVYSMRIETVSATGNPSGSLYKANATGTCTFPQTESGKTMYFLMNGATGVSVTQGDQVAVVIKLDSVTGTGTSTVNGCTYMYPNAANSPPFGATSTNAGSTWTKVLTSPMISLQYGTQIISPVSTTPPSQYTTTTTSASATYYVGNRFSYPFSCTCKGAWLYADVDVDIDVLLFGPDSTVPLAYQTIYAAQRGATTGALNWVTFTSPIPLQANSVYRLVINSFTGTGVTIAVITFNSFNGVSPLDAMPMGRAEYSTSTSSLTTPADWVDNIDVRFRMGIVIDEINFGGSSSGDMNGGFF